MRLEYKNASNHTKSYQLGKVWLDRSTKPTRSLEDSPSSHVHALLKEVGCAYAEHAAGMVGSWGRDPRMIAQGGGPLSATLNHTSTLGLNERTSTIGIHVDPPSLRPCVVVGCPIGEIGFSGGEFVQVDGLIVIPYAMGDLLLTMAADVPHTVNALRPPPGMATTKGRPAMHRFSVVFHEKGAHKPGGGVGFQEEALAGGAAATESSEFERLLHAAWAEAVAGEAGSVGGRTRSAASAAGTKRKAPEE